MILPLAEASFRLDHLITRLAPGEELTLTDQQNRPYARIIRIPSDLLALVWHDPRVAHDRVSVKDLIADVLRWSPNRVSLLHVPTRGVFVAVVDLRTPELSVEKSLTVQVGDSFPKPRHYSAVPVCISVSAITFATFGILGWEPFLGFAVVLAVSILLTAVAFAIGYPKVPA